MLYTDLLSLWFLFISFAVAGVGWGKRVYLLLLTVNQLNVSLPPVVSLLPGIRYVVFPACVLRCVPCLCVWSVTEVRNATAFLSIITRGM